MVDEDVNLPGSGQSPAGNRAYVKSGFALYYCLLFGSYAEKAFRAKFGQVQVNLSATGRDSFIEGIGSIGFFAGIDFVVNNRNRGIGYGKSNGIPTQNIVIRG